jgi:hypothetical protein
MTSATYAPQTSWPGNQRNSTSIPSAAYLSQTFQSGSGTESVSAPWHGSAGGAEIRADQTQGVPASTREAVQTPMLHTTLMPMLHTTLMPMLHMTLMQMMHLWRLWSSCPKNLYPMIITTQRLRQARTRTRLQPPP